MVATEAQKRAMKKYKAKMMADPQYRDEYNKKTNHILKQKYKEDETFRENRKEYANLKYYYDDSEDKALKAIRRLF
jgi:hypothetical protein